MAQAPQAAQMHPANANRIARAHVLDRAIDMTQQIYSNTFVPSAGNNVVNIVPRNVGLIKGFWVKVHATVTNSGTGAITPTTFGIANLLSQITFNDLNNYVRINTAGWHLNVINTVKSRRAFGAAFTNDSPIPYGNNFAPFVSVASIAQSGTGNVTMWYWVPLAYDHKHLEGAVWGNVINATMNLQLTVNPTPVVTSAVDPTLAVYKGGASGAGSITSCTITVYQNFLDQLPAGPGGIIVPALDLNRIYELKNTNAVGMVANQDFPVPYTNFRDFLSTTFIYDNAGVLNAGTDISKISIQSANFTNIFQVEPALVSLWTRQHIMDDTPLGTYYLSHREKPINTQQYGNMELLITPSAVSAGAVLLIGFESMGTANTIVPAGSLPGG